VPAGAALEVKISDALIKTAWHTKTSPWNLTFRRGPVIKESGVYPHASAHMSLSPTTFERPELPARPQTSDCNGSVNRTDQNSNRYHRRVADSTRTGIRERDTQCYIRRISVWLMPLAN
jgi:hypothetical protein